MLITMNSLDDYYPALAINFMMKTIKNSVSISIRKDALQALVFAVRCLDSKCVNYVELIMPPFLDLIRSINDNLITDLVIQLGILISYIKKPIEPFLNAILDIIESFWLNAQKRQQPKMIVALIDLIQCISNVMDIEFKHYIPKVLPLVLKQLKSEIDEGTCTNTHKILILLRSTTICLENYINLILVQFADYLVSRELTNVSIKQDLMYTLYTFARQISLSDNCAILFQCFIRILESNSLNMQPPAHKVLSNNPMLTSTLRNMQQNSSDQQDLEISMQQQVSTASLNYGVQQQQTPILSVSYLLFLNSRNGIDNLTDENLSIHSDLITLTLETLYLLARQLGNKYFVFATMFDKILLKNRHYSRLHEQLIINSREASFFIYWNNMSLLNDGQIQMDRRPQVLTQTGLAAAAAVATPLPDSSRAVNSAPISFGPIKVNIDQADQLASREGWRDSFKKVMSSIVQETPISSLRACSLIPYETVPPDIFNASFISIWIKLNEREQNEIIRYLNLALMNSNVPEIIKIILNLVEFTERCGKYMFLFNF